MIDRIRPFQLISAALFVVCSLSGTVLRATSETEEGAARERQLLAQERLLTSRYGGWDLADLHRRAARTRLDELDADRAARGKARSVLAVPVWVSLGPTVRGHRLPEVISDDSGLVAHIALHPTDPKIIFVASAGGGVWRTKDGGGTWALVTDALGAGFQVGAVAISASDPKRVYAGTGCADASSYILGVPRSSYSLKTGIGLLISTDGGDSWRVSRTSPANQFWDLLVDPGNAAIVLAAGDQGIQRSTDGGDTWTAVLRSETAPWATCLSRSVASPGTIFAASWGKDLPGSIWKSTDGGLTWVEKVNGLPGDVTTRTRIEVAVAPSDANRVYALVSGDRLQLDGARSTDGGETWTALGLEGKGVDVLSKQGNFATILSVDPKNPDVVYAGGLDSWKSTDGGITWTRQSDWAGTGLPYLHADHHAHAHAADGTVYFGTDGGLFASSDGGASFRALNKGFVTFLVNDICHDPNDPERIIIGAQDNSTSIRSTGTEWKETFTGDGYGCTFHPTNRDLILAAVQSQSIYRSMDAGKTWKRQIEGLTEARGASASFRTLLLRHPAVPGRVFTYTSRKIWVTNDFAETWSQLSQTMPIISSINDLHISRSEPNRMSLIDAKGQVVVSANGGVVWEKAGEVPGWYFSAIRIDRTDPRRLWAATRDPRPARERVLVSTDSGATWTALSRSGQLGGLPDLPVNAIEQDERDPNVLWAGTFTGLYRSGNAGQTWERYGQGLPAVPVMGITPLADGSRIRVGTFGRGAWEIAAPASVPAAAGAIPRAFDTPQADFDYTPMISHPGRTVKFEDASTGTPTSFAWDFGDGTTSTVESPDHVFEKPGTFTVSLNATNASGSSKVSKDVTVAYPNTGTGDALTYLLPVVLTDGGAGGSSYTSELTLTNRTDRPLNLTFLATGTFDASSNYTLKPGQEVHTDVFTFLKDFTGMAVPADPPYRTSLRIEVRGADFPGQFGALVRVTTPPTEELGKLGVKGRFGLSYPATPLSTGATSEAVVYGLQQTSEPGKPGTRANLACVHAGPASAGPVKLAVTYHDGVTGKDNTSQDTFELTAFQWDQRTAPLASRSLQTGWATIRKTSGSAQFVCYGVLNDNITNDGAFLTMVVTDTPSTVAAEMIPVIVNTETFRSELTVANRTKDLLDVNLAFVPNVGAVPSYGLLTLKPGEQKVFADVFRELPSWGVNIPEGTIAGAVYAELEVGSGADPNDPVDWPSEGAEEEPEPVPTTKAFVGVRTYATQADGLFGLAYGPLPLGEAADTEAWVYGLQQTGEKNQVAGTRANLAVVHTLNGNEEPLQLDVTYFGPDGNELGKDPDCSPCTLKPGEWRQFNEPLKRYGVPSGFARVRRAGGSDQFLAYGVLNDQLNGDGSYVAMTVP